MAMPSAPILSTPAEHILEETTAATLPAASSRLSEEQLYVQYEIKRTVEEIRHGRFKRIALQFPDDMLVDAPKVFEALQDRLKIARREAGGERRRAPIPQPNGTVDQETDVSNDQNGAVEEHADERVEERLCILADTSYGACCVDEVAAEHVDADVVVHYGRSCLSPTARLPVIYVFTTKLMDVESAIQSFINIYPSKDDKICLMADIPYAHCLDALQSRLAQEGYTNTFKTTIIHKPASLLPNRTVPPDVEENPDALREYSIFHIATPPTTLLLILSSRIKSMHIFPTDSQTPMMQEASTAQLLRRRYALLTRLSTVPVFGILINTLSVSNYMDALAHVQDLIARAGKKSYTFVVGKLNPAKIANFDEVGGWVVIGCWESSLVESKEFLRPIITPFELEVALMDDNARVWGGEWIGDFSQLLLRPRAEADGNPPDGNAGIEGDVDDASEDEPPEFDLRTGRYVSHSRPMGRRRGARKAADANGDGSGPGAGTGPSPPPQSALVQRAKGDNLALINGQFSPAAEFLRSKRTWQGLGSDFEIAYERDEDGKIRGAAVEEGRGGVAKGYSIGDDAQKT